MKKMIALILSLMMMFSVALAEDISAEEAAPILENVKIHLSMDGEMGDGFITVPEDPAKSNIGMYIIMK